jgi:hypothetical protein
MADFHPIQTSIEHFSTEGGEVSELCKHAEIISCGEVFDDSANDTPDLLE